MTMLGQCTALRMCGDNARIGDREDQRQIYRMVLEGQGCTGCLAGSGGKGSACQGSCIKRSHETTFITERGIAIHLKYLLKVEDVRGGLAADVPSSKTSASLELFLLQSIKSA